MCICAHAGRRCSYTSSPVSNVHQQIYMRGAPCERQTPTHIITTHTRQTHQKCRLCSCTTTRFFFVLSIASRLGMLTAAIATGGICVCAVCVHAHTLSRTSQRESGEESNVQIRTQSRTNYIIYVLLLCLFCVAIELVADHRLNAVRKSIVDIFVEKPRANVLNL